MNYKIILISLAGAILMPVNGLAQEYVYPNKKLADEGLLEYRRYTLEEARAYEKGGSFDSYLITDWSEERRLTEDESVIYPRVVTVGDSIFCSYIPIYPDKPYFIRSFNSGMDWDQNICLMDTGGYPGCFFSEILTNGEELLLGFTTQYPSDGNCLNYFKSSDWGNNWSAIDTVLPYYSELFLHYSSFCNVGNRIHASYIDSYYDSIYVITSLDWGQYWNGRGVNVAYLSGTPQPMTVRAWGDYVYLVWVNETPLPVEVRYSMSADSGTTWTDEIDFAQDPDGAQLCFIAVEGTHVVVSWMGYKYSPYAFTGDLFIRQSFDGGETWGEEQVLTDLHKVWLGSVYIKDSLIVATWQDTRFGNGNDEAMVRYSLDYGNTWTDEEQLSFGDYHSNSPIACETGDRIHILWGDQREAAPGLYYSYNDIITGIDDNPILPEKNALLTSHPNPFNSTTIISYSNAKGGDITIYDITGRLVKTLNVGGIKEGKIAWDATDNSGTAIAAGVYFAKVRTSAGVMTAKLVYLK